MCNKATEKLPKPNVMLIIDAIDDGDGQTYGGAAMYGEDGNWYWTFDRVKTEVIPYRILKWRYMKE